MHTKSLYQETKLLLGNDTFSLKMDIAQDSFYHIALEMSANTDWAITNNESCLLQIDLYSDQSFINTFHMVTYMGRENHLYEANLGFLAKGSYEIVFTHQRVPVCEDSEIHIHDVSIISPILTEEEQLVYEHLPFLYGRNHFSAYDSCYTDTPLAMLYSIEQDKDVIQIEYHCIFSHEDEGTPGKLLLAKWGRLTDIEWCYSVWLDRHTNKVIKRAYQGPHHENRDFTGDFLQHSKRPILQVRTTNGNFDHIIDSSYCFSLVPAIYWDKEKQPREWFMKDYPHFNVVMIKEAERQLVNHENIHHKVQHPTTYLYCFFYMDAKDADAVIDLFYEVEGQHISSSYHFHPEIFGHGSYTGQDRHFTIAIEARAEDIQRMNVRLLNGHEATLRQIAFHTMSASGQFIEVKSTHSAILLTSKQKYVSVREFLS